MNALAIKQLPDHPDLDLLEAEARQLSTTASFDSHSDALNRVSHRYGFSNWPQLVDYVGSIGSMGELEQAIQDDDADRIEPLLRDDPALIYRQGHWVKRKRHNGYLPLAYAAFFGKAKVMKTLIAAGADVHEGGERALRAAACHDENLPAVELLISHGADPNASTDSPSGRSYRIIDYPCMTLAFAMLRHLVTLGGKPEPENVGMILATNERRPRDKADCLRVMTDAGFVLPDTPPMALHQRDTRLLESHLHRDSGMLSRLYSQEEIFPAGFGIDRPSPYAYATPLAGGVTLLHMAVEFCDVEMAEWLLVHGADANAVTGTDSRGFGGWTPLFHGMATLHVPRDYSDMAELLLGFGADPTIRASVRKPTTDGGEAAWEDVSALEYARRFIYPDLVNHDAMGLVTEAIEATGDHR